MDNFNKRLVFTRTEGEWAEINKRIEEMDIGSLNNYLRSKIFLLNQKFNECPNCVTPASGAKKKIQYRIPDHLYPPLLALSEKMGRPISCIIEDIFIVPLLLPETV